MSTTTSRMAEERGGATIIHGNPSERISKLKREEDELKERIEEDGGLRSLLINMASGGVGGLCVVAVGYPFDIIKTRLQVSSGINQGLNAEIRAVWRMAGWRGFYQGVTAPLIGVAPIFAVNFYGYELGKRLYGRYFSIKANRDHSLGQLAFGAAFSSLQTALIVIPAERIKVFMQMPRSKDNELGKLNAFQVGLHLFREGGWRGLYRGATATLTRDVPGLVTFFTSYELLKRQLSPINSQENSVRHVGSIMVAGGLAGMLSWLVSLPSDVLKSRVQSAGKEDALGRERFPTIVVLRNLLYKEGPTALYRGLVPVLARAFPANAACFLGYEMTKSTLQSICIDNVK